MPLWLKMTIAIASCTWLLGFPLSIHQAHGTIPDEITIQGSLTSPSGGPLTGTRDYRIRFFDSETNPTEIGSANGLVNLSSTGRFTINVVPPPAVLTTNEAWYELSVDLAGDGIDPTDIFPNRVRFRSVPFALRSVDANSLGGIEAQDYTTDTELAEGLAMPNHDHLGQTWIGDDNPLIIQGRFPDQSIVFPLKSEEKGLITALPSAPLILRNDAPTGNALLGFATDTAIHGSSRSGDGVYGETNGVNSFAGRFINMNNSGSGVYVKGGDNVADIELGGPRGTVTAIDEAGSQIALLSNANVFFFLNLDSTGNDGTFQVIGPTLNSLLLLDQNGNLDLQGNLVMKGVKTRMGDSRGAKGEELLLSSVNSVEEKTVLDGVVELDGNGEASVDLPDYFGAMFEDYRYNLTPIGAPAPMLHIAETIEGNHFKIAGGSSGLEVSWMVSGARREYDVAGSSPESKSAGSN